MWFNVEMKANDPDAEALRTYCHANGIYFETSGIEGGYLHFEIKCDQATTLRINREVFYEK